MKQNIGPGVLIAVVVVVIGLVGFFAYRTFFTDPNYTPLKGEKAEKEFEASQKNSAIYKRLGGHGGHSKQ